MTDEKHVGDRCVFDADSHVSKPTDRFEPYADRALRARQPATA